jgi:hypothetical protein
MRVNESRFGASREINAASSGRIASEEKYAKYIKCGIDRRNEKSILPP